MACCPKSGVLGEDVARSGLLQPEGRCQLQVDLLTFLDMTPPAGRHCLLCPLHLLRTIQSDASQSQETNTKCGK